MAIPTYADERSYNRFRKSFVGSFHGENGSSYRMYWSPECNAQPTKMVFSSGAPICAYCGHEGLPLQPYIEEGDYQVYGYTCVCKGAMDEEAWQQEQATLISNHQKEMELLLERKPKTNPAVIKGLINTLTRRLQEAETLDDVNTILDKLKSIHED
ncbi:TPA: hypothetical protein MCM29_005139 [Klebsiella pneumoniae]|nr:hypothetical protein [Klebsiella pneumoniae]